jgi:predicted PurR-regulated permease PerM
MWRMLVVVGACVLAAGALFAWSSVLFPLLAGFLLAYITHPLASFFERRRLPRILGFLAIVLLFLGVIALVAIVFVPAVVNEVALIGQKLPSWQEVMQERVAPLLDAVKTRFPQAYGLLQQHLSAWARETLPSVAERVVRWVGKASLSALGLAGAALNLILIPVIAAYLTVDFRRFLAALRRLVPRPVLATVDEVVGEVHAVLSAFARGQLLVSLALAAMYTAGLLIVRAPLALVIGPLAGLLSLVPYLGLVVGGSSALLLSLLEYRDLAHPLGVLIVFVVAQNVEGWILTPRLLGRRVGLHPVWVLVALLLGGELFGLPGVIVAVPVAAALRVLLIHAVQAYQASAFYTGDGPAVVLYVRDGVAACGALRAAVEPLVAQHGLELRVVDVAASPALLEGFGDRVPVLEVDREVVAEGDIGEAASVAALERVLEVAK